MVFSPPEYCRSFAQKKAYQGGVTGTPGPPLATPLYMDFIFHMLELRNTEINAKKNSTVKDATVTVEKRNPEKIWQACR